MSNVINGNDRFELKKGLDQATKNLEIISEGLKGGGDAAGDHLENALTFVERFLSGSIVSHYQLLEDSDQLYDLMELDEARYQTLIGYVIRYGHGDCHCLSIALSETNPNVRLLKVVDAAGLPVHSCIAGVDDTLVMDANGIHLRQALVDYWSRVTGDSVHIQPTTAQELFFFSSYTDDELDQALNGFGYLSLFMAEQEENLSIACPMDMDDHDEDPEFDM